MALVLGIDGGGTKTLLCLADRAGNIVHFARGEGSSAIDNPRWSDNLAALLAGIDLRDVAFATLAIGSYREVAAIDSLVDAGINALLPQTPHEIENDVFMAREAAFPGTRGIVLIAGTGSMAVGGDGEDKLVRTGGWGHVFGDEGSAFWIGREALSLATQALDGRRPAPAFARAIASAIGNADILAWTAGLSHPRSEIAALAAAVSQLAAAGDPTAQRLLDAAIDHLSSHIDAARNLAGLNADAPWCAVGGMTRNRAVLAGLAGRQGGPMSAPALPPVGGSLHRAARRAGWNVDAGWIDTLATGLRPFETGAPTPEKAHSP